MADPYNFSFDVAAFLEEQEIADTSVAPKEGVMKKPEAPVEEAPMSNTDRLKKRFADTVSSFYSGTQEIRDRYNKAQETNPLLGRDAAQNEWMTALSASAVTAAELGPTMDTLAMQDAQEQAAMRSASGITESLGRTALPKGTDAPSISPVVGGGREPTKDEIKNIQERLKEGRYYKGAIDGVLGPETTKALRSFQIGVNLKADKVRDETRESYEDTIGGVAYWDRQQNVNLNAEGILDIDTARYFKVDLSDSIADVTLPSRESVPDIRPTQGLMSPPVQDTVSEVDTDAAVAMGTPVDPSSRLDDKGLTPVTSTSHAQRRLSDLGYVEVGSADGAAGANTRSAVRRYQQQNGLTSTGRLDPPTMESLTDAEADLDTVIQRQISHHEGQKNYPYKDSKGLWTIGIGHLIGGGSDRDLAASGYSDYSEDNPMPSSEVTELFEQDLEDHKAIAEGYDFYDGMSKKGKRAILDLTFNMGDFYNKRDEEGGYVWENLRTQLDDGDWDAAADNLASAAYARQVGQRAITVTNLLRQAGD